MNEWAYERIDTHFDDALVRFTSQYDNMPMMQGVARVWADRVQEMEDAAYQLLTDRWVDAAQGMQLDRIGETVGEPRLARGDDEYRTAILIRIGLNSGSGEPETVIFVMNELLETGHYAEDYPAGILVTTQNEAITLQQQRGIVSVTPAGVRVRGVSVLQEGGVSVGSVTMGGLTTTVNPFFVGLLEQNMRMGRGVATGASFISQVLPELPTAILEQSANVNRFVAHGGTNTTQINPE